MLRSDEHPDATHPKPADQLQERPREDQPGAQSRASLCQARSLAQAEALLAPHKEAAGTVRERVGGHAEEEGEAHGRLRLPVEGGNLVAQRHGGQVGDRVQHEDGGEQRERVGRVVQRSLRGDGLGMWLEEGQRPRGAAYKVDGRGEQHYEVVASDGRWTGHEKVCANQVEDAQRADHRAGGEDRHCAGRGWFYTNRA